MVKVILNLSMNKSPKPYYSILNLVVPAGLEPANPKATASKTVVFSQIPPRDNINILRKVVKNGTFRQI
jgi:hypothetical protein